MVIGHAPAPGSRFSLVAVEPGAMTSSDLSPPGSSILRLPPGPDLRAGLIAAFSDVLAYARHQGAVVEAEPVRAVHEFRKSVRRGRSLLRFSEGWLPRKTARALHRQLKAAFEPTSALRDGDVLGPTLRELLDGQEGALLEAGAAVMEVLEAGGAERLASASAVLVLTRSIETLDGVEQAFASALPGALSSQDIADALATRYSATARARASVVSPAPLDSVHDWRKRTKELRYALELLDDRLDEVGRRAHRGCGRLAKTLGDLADLLALRDFVSVKRRGLRKKQRRLVRKAAAAAVRAGRDAALIQTEPLFAPSPQEFAACFVGTGPPTAASRSTSSA